MSEVFWLGETQFSRLEPLLPKDTRGKPRGTPPVRAAFR